MLYTSIFSVWRGNTRVFDDILTRAQLNDKLRTIKDFYIGDPNEPDITVFNGDTEEYTGPVSEWEPDEYIYSRL